jgi:hypothetical protein
MQDTTHGLGRLLAQVRGRLGRTRATQTSRRAVSREDRRAARAARSSLERDLAGYTSPADLNDLDAILDRYSDEETTEIRRISAARRAALRQPSARC